MRFHRLAVLLAGIFLLSDFGAIAQTSNLTLSSAVVNPGGTATLSLGLTESGTAPAGLQWTVSYSSAQISAISITPGPAVSAAAKTLSCASGPGTTTCIVTGMNTNPIGSGVLANLNATVAPATITASLQAGNSLGVNPGGTGLILTSGVSGTIVVPSLLPVTCSPAALSAGNVSTCTVTLTQAAPAGGSSVTLASNNALLTVPASITIAAGATTAAFSARASASIASNQNATVTATFGPSSQTATINLLAAALVSGLACSPVGLSQGAVSTCTVTLAQAAPAGGSSVTLASNNALLTVPASVTVAAGATTAAFSARASASIASNQNATVTATLGASSQTATINLLAAALVSGLACSPAGLSQGAVSTCTVTLAQAAPAGGSSVTLASNNALLTVPASVTIAAGATTAAFSATASASIASNQTATITATLGASSQTATINLLAAALVSGLACSPAGLSQGAVSTCTVTLAQAAPAGGSSVALTSNNALLTVPASVTVAAGATTAAFSATASASIASNQNATVTATLGASSQTATINLFAPALLSGLACSPASLSQGAVSTCTVTLAQTAPPGGSSVALASNNTLLTVPASFTVAAGTASGTFSATAAASIPANEISTASTTGLAAYWPFDEASGVIAHDASGSGNNGTLECNGNCAPLPSWTAGNRNGALSFSMAKDFVTVPDSPGLRVTSQFSFAFWVKVPAGASGITYLGKVNYFGLLNGYSISTGRPGNYIYINLFNNGREVARCAAGGVIKDQIWEHYAITYDGANIRIYVNGAQNTVCAASGSAGTDSTPLSIGGTNQFSPTGIMDEVRIYNRPLSAAEVAAVYTDPGVVSVTATLGSGSQTATLSLVAPSSGSSSQTDVISRRAPVSGTTASGNITATAPAVRSAVVATQTQITQTPTKMQSISCQPGRSQGICRIQFTNPSDSGTVDLSLESSNPAIKVPATLTVQPGQSSIRFRIDATPEWQGDSTTITAQLGEDELLETVSLNSAQGPQGVPGHLNARYGTQIQFRVSPSDPSATLAASDLPPGAVFTALPGSSSGCLT